MKKVLIVSAHSDDESFGMGGTLLKIAKEKQVEIYWLILTEPWAPKWTEESIEDRKTAINKVKRIVGFKEVMNWGYKDNLLDTVSKNELQERLIKYIDSIKPNIIFTPSSLDFNFEHRLVFELVEMSTKSYYSPFLEEIIAYEIPSSTEASLLPSSKFRPNLYYDISEEIHKKIDLIKSYSAELHTFPHPRSKEYIKALAKVRGGEIYTKYAEGFIILRSLRK